MDVLKSGHFKGWMKGRAFPGCPGAHPPSRRQCSSGRCGRSRDAEEQCDPKAAVPLIQPNKRTTTTLTRVTYNGGDNTKYMKGHLYVDTESIMAPDRLALISICCPRAKSVLLWRVHEMSRERLTAVRHSIEDLDSTHNIQPNVHPIPALIDVAKNYGVILDKSDTLSDWGVFKLRRDQEEYAAMDALVLYAIDGGRIVEQSERPLREPVAEMTGGYCRTDTFVIEWKRSARTMKKLSSKSELVTWYSEEEQDQIIQKLKELTPVDWFPVEEIPEEDAPVAIPMAPEEAENVDVEPEAVPEPNVTRTRLPRACQRD
ncbi:unnamed protein product [Caenorhabditis nigoni]